MAEASHAAMLARLRATFDLYDLAEKVMRQNLRRRHPDASDADIERRLISWLRKDPNYDA
jgi:predicted kinase